MLGRLALTTTFVFLAGSAAIAAVPKSLGTFENWSAWVYREDGRARCYIYSTPISKTPPRLDHGDVSFFVRATPQGASRTEANLQVGYPFAPGSSVKADIGDQSFQLMVQEQNAWLPTADQEDNLLAAMRGGAKMSISATSKRGNTTGYEFSLDGVTAAMRRIQTSCP